MPKSAVNSIFWVWSAVDLTRCSLYKNIADVVHRISGIESQVSGDFSTLELYIGLGAGYKLWNKWGKMQAWMWPPSLKHTTTDAPWKNVAVKRRISVWEENMTNYYGTGGIKYKSKSMGVGGREDRAQAESELQASGSLFPLLSQPVSQRWERLSPPGWLYPTGIEWRDLATVLSYRVSAFPRMPRHGLHLILRLRNLQYLDTGCVVFSLLIPH